MMGGDLAPLEAVKGVWQYFQEKSSTAHLYLIGDQQQLEQLMAEYKPASSNFTLVHASEVIGMHESPTRALKEKPQSSIAIGFGLLAKGKIDAIL